jgi:transposase
LIWIEAVSKGQPLWFYERAKKRGSRSIPHLVQVAILLVCAKSKVVFKNYTPNQVMMLPPSLEELITANHPVRIVNQVIDRINIDPLLKKFKGGGTSSYHPRLLLKVLVYGYLNNTYSSRKMEAAIKENIHFMWLAGDEQTRSQYLKPFSQRTIERYTQNSFWSSG